MLSELRLNKIQGLLAAWLVFACAQVPASQVVPLSVEQLAARAQRIVHGKVASKTCLKNERGEIYTRIELDVIEVWKGPATNHFVIVQAGGILGEERVEVVGQVEYRAGEEIVDFLAVNSRGEGVSLGAGQGKFNVLMDEKTGVARAASRFIGHGAGALTLENLRTRTTGGQK